MAGKKGRASAAKAKAGLASFAFVVALVASVPYVIIWKKAVLLSSPFCLEGNVLGSLLGNGDGAFDGRADRCLSNGGGGGGGGGGTVGTLPARLRRYAARDFFYLNCPQNNTDMPPGAYRVALVYLVDVANNWEDIVRDQMHTVLSCGLGRWADSFDVLVSPGASESDKSRVSTVLKEYDGFVAAKPRVVGVGSEGEGEGEGLDRRGTVATIADRIGEACGRHASVHGASGDGETGSNETTVVFYFRNAGALTYHPDWRQHKSISDEGPYSRSLYWRKYAEWFTLERPRRCIEKMLDGAWTCGVNVKTDGAGRGGLYYTPGDVWVSSCDHLLSRAIPNGQISLGDGALSIGRTDRSHMDHKHHRELHRYWKKDPSKHLIYPEEYDETASRFRLMCPNEPFPDGRYKLAMGYHVGMLNNWREVVTDQLNTLSRCGLGRKASSFLLSYSKGDPKELLDLISAYDIFTPTMLINATKSPWECPINTAMRDYCKAATEPTVMFYFHNKGVSKYKPDWRSRMDVRRTYGKSLYWRKLIEFFLIERPTLCTKKILSGARTCGLGIRGHHQSGNMWVSSCEYLSTLPPCDGTSYIDSELWLQQGMRGEYPRDFPEKYAQMWNPPKVEGGTSEQLLNLYHHLALPEEYSNETYLNRSMMLSGERI